MLYYEENTIQLASGNVIENIITEKRDKENEKPKNTTKLYLMSKSLSKYLLEQAFDANFYFVEKRNISTLMFYF